MVERQLAEEGLTKHDLGREKFEARVWEWKEEYGGRIVEQMKRAGVSCDWTRRTLHARSRPFARRARSVCAAVRKGPDLSRPSTWSTGARAARPRCRIWKSSTRRREGNLWHIRYPVNGSDVKLVVATTRPETMLGDTAVAINPKDPRAAELRRQDRAAAADGSRDPDRAR